jgi:hypothetical protein
MVNELLSSSLMNIRRQLTLAAVALAWSVAIVSAETAVATKWRPLGEAQRDCLTHAQMAIFRAGFNPATGGSESMSGKRGDYTASIRCVATQRIVFFVMSGPSPETTARYLDALFGHF